jgi:hypothetical protein
MAFLTITSGQTDANSPVDVALMDTIRTNFDYLYGIEVTNGNGHDHAGGDGAKISAAGLNAACVTQVKLSTAIGEVSTASSANLTLPGGVYGFYPQLKGNFNDPSAYAQLCLNTNLASYVTNIFLNSYTGTVYAQQRYVQASPPYKVGDVEWPHFLYMLVNSTGDVVASYAAEDPPYAYNGPEYNEKDSIERISAVPHPFADYAKKDPTADGLEIVLVDLREYDIKEWKEDSAKKGIGILEDLGHVNKKGKIITPQELGVKDIKGFTDKVKIRKSQ